jgi:hypothetical protein
MFSHSCLATSAPSELEASSEALSLPAREEERLVPPVHLLDTRGRDARLGEPGGEAEWHDEMGRGVVFCELDDRVGRQVVIMVVRDDDEVYRLAREGQMKGRFSMRRRRKEGRARTLANARAAPRSCRAERDRGQGQRPASASSGPRRRGRTGRWSGCCWWGS